MPGLRPETVLGFDYGTRRIGIAIGHSLTGTANPLITLECPEGRPDWDAIAALIEQWRPARLILGMPRHLDGAEHALKPAIEKFARRLEGRFRLPVHTVDERLSSAEAEARLKALRRSGRNKKIRKEDIDKLAAAIMLETWFAGTPETDNPDRL